jgi:AcrR family transcriptional regulator
MSYDGESEAASANYTEVPSALQMGLGEVAMSVTEEKRQPDGGAPRPMRADARRNYQALVSAASAAFFEHGADDASLEEIARRAGVGIGTLYRHFPTRQALLEAVYRDQVELICARASELLDSAPPEEALVTWLRALVQFGSTKRSLTSALLATLDKDSELLSSCSAMMRQSADALLTRAQDAGVVRRDAQSVDVLRMVHGVSMVAQRTPADAGQADRMIGLIMDGLRYQPAG